MRMKDLERESGLPRSAIHFYLREGILPPGSKTARNAATYSEAHVTRLQAIARHRGSGRELPVPLLRRAAELMDRGVEPDVAIALEQSVAAGVPTGPADEGVAALSPPELATRAGVPVERVEALIEARLLVPLPGHGEPTFDATDIPVLRTLHELFEVTGFDPAVGSRISDLVRELSRYEMALRNRVVGVMGEDGAAELTLKFQQTANLLHAYLFYRWRLHDIAELRAQERGENA